MSDKDRNRGGIELITFQDTKPHSDLQLPPWLFRHNDLIRGMASAVNIDKEKLINILNYNHFKGDPLYVLLSHPHYTEEILVKVYPEPCLGNELSCRWAEAYSIYKLERYRFQYLLLSHEQSIIVVPGRLIAINRDGLKMQLPEIGLVTSKRQNPRFTCHDVRAELWQNGFQAKGSLIDFSPHAFRIRVQPTPPSAFSWFNMEAPANIHLSSELSVLYSGNCNCMYQHLDGQNREIVLTPVQDQIQRFRTKKIRNPRRQNSPPFHVIFEHPFMKRTIQREIYDISMTGFSIYDKLNEVVLMPGMIIPDMIIAYAGILKIRCKVQVIYRKDEPDQVRFGLVILDADMANYKNLSHVINFMEPENGTSNNVDLEALWEFLFDAGFIYPQKYKCIHSLKDDFNEVYRRLYEGSPEIANYFTYQKNGRIYGHISALRAYERTWMVQHHAARPIEGRPIGLIVLKKMLHYLYDLCRLPSANMDYVIAYYSPENEFPDRAFGDFTRHHGNPQHCSLDLFSYMNYPTGEPARNLPEGWSLRECSSVDLWEFEQYYRNHSGGLCCSIFKRHEQQHRPPLEEIYARNGFIRSWKNYVLAGLDIPKAFIVLEESDEGINLSNLLNGFKVFVMDPDLPWHILVAACSKLLNPHTATSASLLIYPYDYAERAAMGSEMKQYLLWVTDMQWANEYIEYLKRKFRMSFI